MNGLVFEIEGSSIEIDTYSRDLITSIDRTDELHGLAKPRMVAPGPGEQGGLVEAVEIAHTAGPVVSAVAAAFFVWLGERAKNRRISVQLTRRDGTSLTVSAGDPADVPAVQELVTKFLDDDATG
jgi:hypothetical protein